MAEKSAMNRELIQGSAEPPVMGQVEARARHGYEVGKRAVRVAPAVTLRPE